MPQTGDSQLPAKAKKSNLTPFYRPRLSSSPRRNFSDGPRLSQNFWRGFASWHEKIFKSDTQGFVVCWSQQFVRGAAPIECWSPERIEIAVAGVPGAKQNEAINSCGGCSTQIRALTAGYSSALRLASALRRKPCSNQANKISDEASVLTIVSLFCLRLGQVQTAAKKKAMIYRLKNCSGQQNFLSVNETSSAFYYRVARFSTM